MSLDEKLAEAGYILDEAMEEYKPSHVFGLFSGGNDSLTVTHFASNHLESKIDRIVHINTGIGLPETRQFVGETCERFNWRLLEIRAKEDCGQDYEQLVLEHGFPGPAHHYKMFQRLKERALEKLARDHKDGRRKILLISGLRLQESGRRMRLKHEPVQVQGRRIWCAPFFFMSNDEVGEYRERFAIPESPVRKYLCMSGECLCGSFAKPGELKEIDLWFPETGRRIRNLQTRVIAAGFPWGWGERPPAAWTAMKQAERTGQSDAFGLELKEEVQMLCTSCQFRHERDGDSASDRMNVTESKT